MNQTEREETTRAVEQFLNESLERILLSNPVNPHSSPGPGCAPC